MGLYVVLHDNRFFKRGDWIDEDELGMVQKVEMLQVGNRYEPQRYVGPVVELSPIRHLCIRIQKRGLDNEPPCWHLYTEQWSLDQRVRKELGSNDVQGGDGRNLRGGTPEGEHPNSGGECNLPAQTQSS